MVCTCPEEVFWIQWTKDVEDRAAGQKEKWKTTESIYNVVKEVMQRLSAEEDAGSRARWRQMICCGNS